MLRDKGGYKENRLRENLHDCDYMTLLMVKKKNNRGDQGTPK